MLRAKVETNGHTTIVIGLSTGNLRRLKENKPILLSLQEEYGLDASLLILWGETEEAIRKEITANGLPLRIVDAAPITASSTTLPSDPSLELGATGENRGELSPFDEGELRAGIVTAKGQVVINFGKPVAWLAMHPEQAKLIGAGLIARAEELEKATAS